MILVYSINQDNMLTLMTNNVGIKMKILMTKIRKNKVSLQINYSIKIKKKKKKLIILIKIVLDFNLVELTPE